MALELNKLTGQVEAMGQALARRQQEHADLVAAARATLTAHARVTAELRQKIAQAHQADASWRGAEPLGERLDERHTPGVPAEPATLIAADGSQIYPDRHGIALYYLVNVGSIVLRQDSGQAPETASRPALFFDDADLYDEAGRLRTPEYVNRQRDRREVSTLVELAEAERAAQGGDLSRPILTLSDGPLLPWTAPLAPQLWGARGAGQQAPLPPQGWGERGARQQAPLPPQGWGERGTREDAFEREVAFLTAQLDRLRRARVLPIGYVDRPNSAYVLRTLELAELAPEEITRETVRRGPYRRLTDRLLFADLEPNQRSGLFASTSEVNDRYAAAGHRILFFYVNVASRPGPEHSIIARVELPEWAAADPVALDLAQQAVYADCRLTGFPYVLARAHELAVVGPAERADLEAMLGQAMLRNRLSPMASAKAGLKLLTGNKRRGPR